MKITLSNDKVHNLHHNKIHKSATAGQNCDFGRGVRIMKGVRLGSNADIGNNVTIHENVTIGNNADIGDNVTIHENVTIGNNADVGAGVTIMPNVTILSNVDVGSYAFISQNSIIKNNQTILSGVLFDNTESGIKTQQQCADSDGSVGCAGVQGPHSLSRMFNRDGPSVIRTNNSSSVTFYIDGEECVVDETWKAGVGTSFHVTYRGNSYSVTGKNNRIIHNNIDLLAEYKKHLASASVSSSPTSPPTSPEEPTDSIFIMIMRALGFVKEPEEVTKEEGEK